MVSPTASRPASPTPSQLPPVPSSPVYSVASTANPISQLNLPLPPAPRPAHAVLTKSDLERSQEAYSELLSSAKAYRLALASLSTAASTFGSALESCARLKEARAEPVGPSSMSASFTSPAAHRGTTCTADALMSASGVQHLVANHQQILSETVYRSFEVPLLHDLDRWQAVIDEEDETYQQRIKVQTKEIKRLEKEGMKLHKQRRRDVSRFRAHLVELTNKLDGLTTTHADHARTMLRESQETSGRIVDASCSLVRAEIDIFEGLARKGWSGGGLDDLLDRGQDLFATEDLHSHHLHNGAAGGGSSGGAHETAKLFSILPPKSILADSASETSRRNHARSDSLGMDTERYQSLTGVASEPVYSGGGGDADSILSAEFNKPRNARPFSPQPIRRITTDVSFDSLGATPGIETPRNVEGDLEHSELRMPVVEGRNPKTGEEEDDERQQGDVDGGDESAEQGWSRRRDTGDPNTPDQARGRASPDFITDESSPDHS